MSDALEHIRYSCGIEGEEVANYVDQLTAKVAELEERRCEICGYAEHHREHTGCLRTQLAAAQEQIANETAEACAELAELMTARCAFQTVEHYKFASAISDEIRSGAWKEFK